MHFKPVLMLLCAVLFAAMLPSQIADFTPHPPGYGVYNLSRAPAPPIPTEPGYPIAPNMWSSSVENADYIFTTWAQYWVERPTRDAAGNIISHEFEVLYWWTYTDKATGVTQPPARVGNGTLFGITGPQLNFFTFATYAPSISLTFAGTNPNGVDGFAIALCAPDNLLGEQIFVHFFELDVSVTPPVWIESVNREAVLASDTPFGISRHPNLIGLPDGDIVVVWQDDNAAGPIGGVPGINPQAPAQNPNNMFVNDIYARRFQQDYPAAPGPGMVDGATVGGNQGSTINLSSSTSAEIFPHATSGNPGEVFITWYSAGTSADNIAGLGPNSGPIDGVVAGETSDIYLRRIMALPGQTGLSTANPVNQAVNVTRSTGETASPPRVAFNSSLNQVGVTFTDDTDANGIAGLVNLNAVPLVDPVTAVVTPRADIFIGLYNPISLAPIAFRNVSEDPNVDLVSDLSGFGLNGWIVGWSTLDGATNINPRIETMTLQSGVLNSTSIKRLYPRQGITSPTTLEMLIFSVNTTSNNSITIHFYSNGGNPDDLRSTEPAAVNDPNNGNNPVLDVFMAYGESTAPPPAAGQLSIEKVTVNSDNPLDIANPNFVVPASIEAEITIQNLSPLSPLILQSINIIFPPGFSRGSGPVLPVTVGQGNTQTFVVNILTDRTKMVPGQNEFEVSATGVLVNVPVVGTGKGILAVTGVKGPLAGVTLSALLNPSVITAGTPAEVEMTLTISNAGQFPVQDVVGLGKLIQGFTPIDLDKIVFTPPLTTTLIPSGGIVVFRGKTNAGAGIQPRSWRPAFTFSMRQGSNVGTVTAMLANEVTILPNPNLANSGPKSGLANSGESAASCALVPRKSNLPWLLLGGLALAAAGASTRRRERATVRQ